MDEQAKDRAHRIGQKNEVRVYRFITNTGVEEGMLSKALFKKGLDDKIIQAGMYNDEASDTDRQKKLEELIRGGKEEDDENEEEEDEILNFAQINELIARDAEELELFNKMDEEMFEAERRDEREAQILQHRKEKGLKDSHRVNYRLIQEWEVPDWIKVKPADLEEE
jgi:hypothetical protein